MKALKIFNIAISIIDEIDPNGSISDANVKDYKSRAVYLLDAWQKEMIKTSDTFKTFEKSFSRKRNLLGDLNQFVAVEHIDQDQIYEAIGGIPYCFYFGVDGPATVYIEDTNGQPIDGTYIYDGGTETPFNGVINADTNTESFRYYKGLISSTTSNIRLRFSGDYYYRHTNRALCPYKYASIDKVPEFLPWIKVTMPGDFKSRTQMINEYPMWQYDESNNHRWEGKNELYVLFSYEGVVRIKYIPVPVEITTLDQELEVDDITAMSGAYYLAEHFFRADMNDTAAEQCRQKFDRLKIDTMIKQPLSPSEIKDVYGLGG